MSYDLMVFEPSAAPRKRKAFMAWYKEQTRWAEGHGYDDPKVASPALQQWFEEMIVFFPPLNGPLAVESEEPEVTDHCIGREVIYSGFAWSVAEGAYAKMRELAVKHEVGFFDVSGGRREILFPGKAPFPVFERPWWKVWERG